MRISDWSSDVCSSDLPDSVVVLDVKRENWSTSAGYRQRAGQSVYLFDPLDPEGRTARYNPLAHIRRADDTEVVNELQKIAVMLFPAPERSDPFWAEAARAAFIGVGALVAANPGMPFTIGEIYRRQIGRASCRARGCPSVYISVGHGS